MRATLCTRRSTLYICIFTQKRNKAAHTHTHTHIHTCAVLRAHKYLFFFSLSFSRSSIDDSRAHLLCLQFVLRMYCYASWIFERLSLRTRFCIYMYNIVHTIYAVICRLWYMLQKFLKIFIAVCLLYWKKKKRQTSRDHTRNFDKISSKVFGKIYSFRAIDRVNCQLTLVSLKPQCDQKVDKKNLCYRIVNFVCKKILIFSLLKKKIDQLPEGSFIIALKKSSLVVSCLKS